MERRERDRDRDEPRVDKETLLAIGAVVHHLMGVQDQARDRFVDQAFPVSRLAVEFREACL
mgnify:CR=1 FL=1